MKSEPMVHNTVRAPDASVGAHVPPARAAIFAGSLRRFLVIAAIAFWLGGFTFYSGVAIPMGVEVLGGHRTVGFITERVTNWLNVAAVGALAILLWNMIAVRYSAGRRLRMMLLVSWLFMLAIQIELVSLHPVMDRLLAPQAREILNEDRFDLLHHVYLISSTLQWFAGVIHVAAISVAWRPAATGPQ